MRFWQAILRFVEDIGQPKEQDYFPILATDFTM